MADIRTGCGKSKTGGTFQISDCVALGIKAPVRESGDLRDAGPVVIEGPKGTLDASSAVIVAKSPLCMLRCRWLQSLTFRTRETCQRTDYD